MVDIAIHERYSKRIVKDGIGQLKVYGDLEHVIFLGLVSNQEQAIKLLDGFDGQYARRKIIADKMKKDFTTH